MKVSASYLENLARDYQKAYAAANDETAPTVTWQRGWFSIGRPAVRRRRKELEEMRDELWRRARAIPSTTRGGAAE
jgi:hypothetical protein